MVAVVATTNEQVVVGLGRRLLRTRECPPRASVSVLRQAACELGECLLNHEPVPVLREHLAATSVALERAQNELNGQSPYKSLSDIDKTLREVAALIASLAPEVEILPNYAAD